jgi:hypothetical protein
MTNEQAALIAAAQLLSCGEWTKLIVIDLAKELEAMYFGAPSGEPTPELAIDVHVGIIATQYEGMKGVIVAGNRSYWEVEIPGIGHPVHFKPESLKAFPKSAQPAIVAEPPAQPAFAVGTRVRVTQTRLGFPVGSVGNVTRFSRNDASVVFVHFDGEGEAPFSQDALEIVALPADILAQLDHADTEAYNEIKRFFGLTEEKIAELRKTEPAPALPQDVLDLSPDEYKAYSMSKKIAIHERNFSKTEGFTPPYIIDALLSKGLIEQIGTGRETTYRAIVQAQPAPAALPEGVTLANRSNEDEIAYNIKASDDDRPTTFQVDWTHRNSLTGIRYDNQYILLDDGEFERFYAALQLIKAHKEAQQ